jgi:hypothetical protein
MDAVDGRVQGWRREERMRARSMEVCAEQVHNSSHKNLQSEQVRREGQQAVGGCSGEPS